MRLATTGPAPVMEVWHTQGGGAGAAGGRAGGGMGAREGWHWAALPFPQCTCVLYFTQVIE